MTRAVGPREFAIRVFWLSLIAPFIRIGGRR